MTTAVTIERIKRDLQAARARKDGPETARLFFSLPLSERSEPVVRPGGAVRLQGATHLPTRTASAPVAGWPTISMHHTVFSAFRNVENDGRELAGFLVGRESDGDLEILEFFEAYNEDTNTWRTVEIDLERGLSALARLPLDRTVIGEFHSHPTGAGVDASNQDLEAGAFLARSFRREHWISLILAKPESRWAIHQEVGAYIIRPDGQHRTANVTEMRSF